MSRRRIGDLSEPWVCPPSLVRVFAKRHAAQALRVASGAARKAERERKAKLARKKRGPRFGWGPA
jgi:hypothetical protein